MKLNFVLSDTTKGATSAALSEVVKLAEADVFCPCIVIVPETKSIIIERELLSLSNTGSFANVFVYSFVRLLDRLGGIAPEKVVSRQSSIMILRKIIYDNFSQLKCYRKSAKTVGFAEKIYEIISQLKSSEISPDELSLALETTNVSLKSKLTDICLLYKKYEEAIGGEHFDDLDRLAVISKLAERSSFIAESNIFVVGFDSVTQEMCSVLKKLAIHANSITFSAVYFNEKRSDRHIQDNHLFARFRHIAEELKYPYVPKFVKTKKKGDFFAIQNFISSTENAKFEPHGGVEVFEASSKKREADFVANKIMTHVLGGGRFRDIGVMVADTDVDLKTLTDCFDAYKIPYFANVSRTIGDHFLARFLRLSLEVLRFNFSPERVLELASNPLFGLADFSGLYLFVKEVGLEYEGFFKQLKPEDFVCANKYNDTLWQDLEKIREYLSKFREKILPCKTIADYALVLQEVIRFFDVDGRLDELSEKQRQSGFIVEAEITRQVFLKLSKFVSGLTNILGELEVSFDEFLAIFCSGISLAKVNIAPVSIDTVIIQDNTDGFFNIKTLFIFGAEDGKLPAKIQDSGMVLDSELASARSLIGKTIDPSVKDTNRRENFKVYEALLEPSEKLYVSYSNKSIGGKPLKRAGVVNRLIALFGEGILTRHYDYAENFCSSILEMKLARAINQFQNDKLGYGEVNELYNLLGENISPKFGEYLADANVQKCDFNINSAREIFFFNSKTSVSQLETYFDCPYKHFARYGLRLSENKDAKLNLPDIGTIVHRVIELFSDDISSFRGLSDAEFERRVKNLVRAAFNEKMNADKNKALLFMLSDECVKVTKYILKEQENSSFKMNGKQEYSFSGKDAIKLGQTGVEIHGKIDRIDEFGDYIRVIDYKTGHISSDLKSIYFGKKIQLPVYLIAALSSGKKVAGVFYFPVHSEYFLTEKDAESSYKMIGFILDDIDVVKNMDHSIAQDNLKSNIVPLWVKFSKTGEMSFNGRQKGVFSEAEFKDIENYTLGLCTQAVEEILNGNIEPSPIADEAGGAVPASCKSCKLYGFCGLKWATNKFGRNLASGIDISCFDLEGGNE